MKSALRQWEMMWDQELADELEAADRGAEMPPNASDPLEVLGALDPLGLDPEEIPGARHLTRMLVERVGAENVWRYRVRYRLELKYIMRF